MTRDLFSGFQEEMTQAQARRVFVVLLKFTHPNWEYPGLFNSDTADLTSDGEVYIACPFEINLPSEGDQVQRARITIQNVDPVLVHTFKAMTGEPRCEIKVVMRSNPNRKIVSYPALLVKGLTANASEISAELVGWDWSSIQFPRAVANKTALPGLFY